MKQKNKKAVAGVLAATMIVFVGTTSAFAAGPRCGRNYADANQDGVCDYVGSVCSYIDSDDDGICDNCGKDKASLHGCGKNYVDADGDGICDNCGKDKASLHGCGKNYVDADGDGVCDNYGTRHGKGSCGRRNRR